MKINAKAGAKSIITLDIYSFQSMCILVYLIMMEVVDRKYQVKVKPLYSFTLL